MILETYFVRLYNQIKAPDPTQPLSLIQTFFVLLALVGYVATIGRAVYTAFRYQGAAQGLLALFFYPLYIIWNVSSLIQSLKG